MEGVGKTFNAGIILQGVKGEREGVDCKKARLKTNHPLQKVPEGETRGRGGVLPRKKRNRVTRKK